MKEESALLTATRRSLSGLPTAAAKAPDVQPPVSDDGSMVRVKAQVMTRSDEGWVAVDGGGLSLVGVFRHSVHVPIAASHARAKPEKEADAYSSRKTASNDKSSRKELLDEPDSAIECSVADEDKQDGSCKVQCYECTEFRIRAQRIADGNVSD